MYILNNFEPDNQPVSVETNTETHQTTLVHLKNHIIQIGKEFRPYCNYFIIKPTENAKRSIDNLTCELVETKCFEFKTHLLSETHKNLEKSKSVNKSDLVMIYGTDKVKKRHKHNAEVGNIGFGKTRHSSPDSLIPKYNENYKSPTQIYSFNLLFSEEFIKEMTKMKEMEKHKCLNFISDFNTEKIECKIANYFCHILSKNEVKVHRLPKSFEYLEHMKYTEKSRDCVYIRFVILLLIILNGRIPLENLPTFRIKYQKIKTILTILGCVKMGNEWILKTAPQMNRAYKRNK